MKVKFVERDTFAEAWVTATADSTAPAAEAAQRIYRGLADLVVSGRIEPFQEKIYGRVEARDACLAARRAAFTDAGLDPDLPCTFHEGTPINGNGLTGVQLWGIQPGDETRVSTVSGPSAPGRCLEGPGFRLLYLPAMRGTLDNGQLAPNVSAQAERTFHNGEAALRHFGMDFGNVIRTWIYMDRILDWYGEFNRVRTHFFRERDVGGGDRRFPASTGIRGRTDGEEISIDILALDRAPDSDIEAAPLMTSRRQERAFDYGSAFSRALGLDLGGRQTVFVSGTASIAPSGETLYQGAPDAQIVQTLMSIAALLDAVGATLDDICLATLFCKTPEIYDAYQEAVRLLRLPQLPIVPMVADVCRPELLVEIEAVAVVPRAADLESSP